MTVPARSGRSRRRTPWKSRWSRSPCAPHLFYPLRQPIKCIFRPSRMYDPPRPEINAETVRLDIGTWYLTEHAVSIAIANRFHAGVPVRLPAIAVRFRNRCEHAERVLLARELGRADQAPL